MDFDKIKENGLKGLSVAAGVGGSVLLTRQLASKVPSWAVPFIALVPGLALTLLSKDKYLTSLGLGMLGTGALVGAKQLTEGKTGILQTINSSLPALNGPADDNLMMQYVNQNLLSGPVEDSVKFLS
jgi:hypothetical protein